VRRAGDAGYLHRLIDVPKRRYEMPKQGAMPLANIVNWNAKLQEFRARLTIEKLCTFADSLGVSAVSLDRLGVGLTWESVWAFPMSDGMGVVGFRLRNDQGDKWAERGSRNALFIPAERKPAGPLIICEGPTDTAAMLDWDYDAVGRASCNTGARYLLSQCVSRIVVIMSDNDGPGVEGANRLAKELRCAESVRVVRPAKGKDVREWKRLGATRHDVEKEIRP